MNKRLAARRKLPTAPQRASGKPPINRRAAQSLHEAIVSNMAEGVCLVSALSGQIVYANATYEAMLGYGPGELDGAPVAIVNAPTEKSPEDVARNIIDTVKRLGYWSGEVDNVRKDGARMWCRSVVTMFDHAEHGRLLLGVNNDITETYLARQERDLALQQIRRLTLGLQEAIEAERMALARDVHDQLGAALTGMRMQLEGIAACRERSADDLRSMVLQVSQLAAQTLVQTRAICNRLRPQLLDELGLVQTLRWYLGQWSQETGIAVQTRLPTRLQEPEPALATELFRMLQEMLTNVARHAGASRVQAGLSGNARYLRLTVADDGKGFDPAQVYEGLGLMGLRERARRHQGQVQIDSSSAGTRVVVTLERGSA